MLLARRNLFQEKTRFVLCVSGVALAVMLVLVLTSFERGMYKQLSAYLEHAPGSVVVLQEGVDNLLASSSSTLPATTLESVRDVPGVQQAVPILSRFIVVDIHAKKQPVYLIGYDLQLGGGPWAIVAGQAPQADSDVVLDAVLAKRHSLGVGDTLEMLGREFTISGLSDGTTSWMLSFVFVRISAAQSLFLAPGISSAILLSPDIGIEATALREWADSIPGSTAILKRDVVANDQALYGGIFSAPIRLMAGIALVVGALVVGFVIYTSTIERQREYGVFKAIGASNRVLYRVLVSQAVISASTGAVAGIGLAFTATQLIMTLRPQFLLVVEPVAISQALIAGALMAVLAALVPDRVVARLAPAEAFQR